MTAEQKAALIEECGRLSRERLYQEHNKRTAAKLELTEEQRVIHAEITARENIIRTSAHSVPGAIDQSISMKPLELQSGE